MRAQAKPQSSWRHAASAATAAVVLVICGSPLVSSRPERNPVAEVLADLPHRPTVSRLSGDAAYRAYKPPDVRLDAIRDLDETLKAHPRPDRRSQLHALGIAALLRRDYAVANRHLREAVALAEAQPIGPARKATILNDFAVAHYEHGRAGSAKSFIVALEASEKAWALDRTPATAWTRAVLLSAFALPDTAASAWEDYLALDSTSPWAKEVARERRMLPPRVAERVRASAAQLRSRTSLATMQALANGSVFIAKCDTAVGEFLRADDKDGAVRTLLLRAAALDTMHASDEAWRDRLKARALASNETLGDAVAALAFSARQQGHLLAGRALTPAAVQTMRGGSVIHFAGHAMIVPGRRSDWGSILQELEEREFASDDFRLVTVEAAVSESMRRLYEREARIEGANGAVGASLWMSDRARTVIEPQEQPSPCSDAIGRGTLEELGNQLARCVPDGVTLIQQDLDAEHLYTWVVRDSQITLTKSRVSAPRLIAEIEQFQADIERNADVRSLRAQARNLHDVLLGPVRQQLAGSDLLVFSPSAELRNLPFHALHDGSSFLVQRRLSTTTATISAFELPRAPAKTASALVVLPPAGPQRQELVGARNEARTVTKIYGPRAALLTGTAATPEAFLGTAASYDILHVATHGQSSTTPNQNAIEFGSRLIRAYDVFQLNLARAPLVMLAACRTADESGGPLNVSLSNAFLAAGASTVVGTLWDVEDRSTEELSVGFHRQLQSGATPQAALQNVQLQFIRSGRPMSAWAAFRISS